MNLFTSAPFLALSAGYEVLTLRIIIWGAVGGLALGAVASLIGRRVPGTLVRALHRAGADCPEKALTLADLGMEKNVLLRRALRDGKALRKYVTLANEADFVVKEPQNSGFFRVWRKIFSLPEGDAVREIDFDRAKFYMTDDARYTAEVRYNGKGADLLGVILSVILLAAIGLFLQWILPELIDMAEGLFGNTRNW